MSAGALSRAGRGKKETAQQKVEREAAERGEMVKGYAWQEMFADGKQPDTFVEGLSNYDWEGKKWKGEKSTPEVNERGGHSQGVFKYCNEPKKQGARPTNAENMSIREAPGARSGSTANLPSQSVWRDIQERPLICTLHHGMMTISGSVERFSKNQLKETGAYWTYDPAANAWSAPNVPRLFERLNDLANLWGLAFIPRKVNDHLPYPKTNSNDLVPPAPMQPRAIPGQPFPAPTNAVPITTAWNKLPGYNPGKVEEREIPPPPPA